ncbi:MAG: hypothetical protein K1Y36_08640 [Blastocatellia bacterium]|nr:hypothetical protein [Blastocatellia bacterium]
MEDPGFFDIWGTVQRGSHQPAVAFLSIHQPRLAALEIRKRVNCSAVQGVRIPILKEVGWQVVLDFRKSPPHWLPNIMVMQEACHPDSFAAPSRFQSYCEKHDYYFGGCCGCHVCNGFFVW